MCEDLRRKFSRRMTRDLVWVSHSRRYVYIGVRLQVQREMLTRTGAERLSLKEQRK